jgi:hypothetical protein
MIKQTKYVPIDVGHTDLMGGGGGTLPRAPTSKRVPKARKALNSLWYKFAWLRKTNPSCISAC